MSTLWEKHTTRTQYVKGLEKREIAEMQHPFEIINVGGSTGRYGKQWELTIILHDEERLITFGSGEYRDQFMEDLLDALGDSSQLPIMATLQTFVTKTNQIGFAIIQYVPNGVELEDEGMEDATHESR